MTRNNDRYMRKIFSFLSGFSTKTALTIDSTNETLKIEFPAAHFIIPTINGMKLKAFPSAIPVDMTLSGTRKTINFQISEFVKTWKKLNSSGTCILQFSESPQLSTFYKLNLSDDEPSVVKYQTLAPLLRDLDFIVEDPELLLSECPIDKVKIDLSRLSEWRNTFRPEWKFKISVAEGFAAPYELCKSTVSVDNLYADAPDDDSLGGRPVSIITKFSDLGNELGQLQRQLVDVMSAPTITGFTHLDTDTGRQTTYNKQLEVIGCTYV